MITKLIATALSAALVLGTASATFAASNNKKQAAAPRKATVTTAPQPDNAYQSFAREAPTTQPVREAPTTEPVRVPEPLYFGHATGH